MQRIEQFMLIEFDRGGMAVGGDLAGAGFR
jgi:hypothetical protein